MDMDDTKDFLDSLLSVSILQFSVMQTVTVGSRDTYVSLSGTGSPWKLCSSITPDLDLTKMVTLDPEIGKSRF